MAIEHDFFYFLVVKGKSFSTFIHKQLQTVLYPEKGLYPPPLSQKEVWGHAPPINHLKSRSSEVVIISSILGLKKNAVNDNFCCHFCNFSVIPDQSESCIFR